MTKRLDEAAWLDSIEDAYGFRLGQGQIYADPRTGLVFAGSEYVARLGATSAPEDATQWAATIAHFPRGTGRLVYSERNEAPR